MNEGIMAVDLDGTLACYDGFKAAKEIGEPIPLMVERVKRWLAEGKTVHIFTTRVTPRAGEVPPRDIEQVREAIEDWCERHLGQRLPVTNIKGHGVIEFWDDRAVRVEKNTGELCL